MTIDVAQTLVSAASRLVSTPGGAWKKRDRI